MKRTAIIAAMLLLSAVRAGAQVDSCFRMALPNDSSHNTLWNPDSIMYDTCLDPHHDGYGPYFVKAGIEVVFLDSGVVPLGYGAPDSILEVGWQAIDTSFPTIRSAFEHLYNHLGPFVLKKRYPSDTSSGLSGNFRLIFQTYTNVDSILADLDSLQRVQVDFDPPEAPAGIVQLDLMVPEQVPFILTRDGICEIPCNARAGDLYVYNNLGELLNVGVTRLGERCQIDFRGLSQGIYWIQCIGSSLTKAVYLQR